MYCAQHISLFKMAVQPGTMAHACDSSTWEVQAVGQEFKASFDYIENWREVLGDLVAKIKKLC